MAEPCRGGEGEPGRPGECEEQGARVVEARGDGGVDEDAGGAVAGQGAGPGRRPRSLPGRPRNTPVIGCSGQNLFFALIYNAIGVPLAAGALYPLWGIRLSPVIAAAAMALSSLSVVTNASRLRRWHSTSLPRTKPVPVRPRVETTARSTASNERVVDPVCGMRLAPTPDTEHRQTAGGTRYFCSIDCAAAFDADPDRYTLPGPGHGPVGSPN